MPILRVCSHIAEKCDTEYVEEFLGDTLRFLPQIYHSKQWILQLLWTQIGPISIGLIHVSAARRKIPPDSMSKKWHITPPPHIDDIKSTPQFSELQQGIPIQKQIPT